MNRKTLSDTDVPNLRFKIKDNKLKGVTLPKPLKPTKYVPPQTPPAQKPAPKPRILSKRPVPIPRTPLPRRVSEKVKKLIDEITPYYKPEAIREFQKILKDRKSLMNKITEKSKALKKM